MLFFLISHGLRGRYAARESQDDPALLSPWTKFSKVLRQFAHALPPYHLAQLALSTVGAGQHESNLMDWEFLIGFTLVCLGVARIGFQRDEGKMYG